MTPHRARLARRAARAVITWRSWPAAGCLLDIPARLLADPRWRERHLTLPAIRIRARAASARPREVAPLIPTQITEEILHARREAAQHSLRVADALDRTLDIATGGTITFPVHQRTEQPTDDEWWEAIR